MNLPNAKLSHPDQASKLWSDVDGEEKRSRESNASRLGVGCSALFGKKCGFERSVESAGRFDQINNQTLLFIGFQRRRGARNIKWERTCRIKTDRGFANVRPIQSSSIADG